MIFYIIDTINNILIITCQLDNNISIFEKCMIYKECIYINLITFYLASYKLFVYKVYFITVIGFDDRIRQISRMYYNPVNCSIQ